MFRTTSLISTNMRKHPGVLPQQINKTQCIQIKTNELSEHANNGDASEVHPAQ